MSRKTLLGAGALVAALLVGGCRDRGGAFPGGPPPDSPTGAPPSGPVLEDPRPVLVEVRTGLVEPRPVDWHQAEVLDERTLRVRFWGGVEECYGVARVEVEYGLEAVTVTVYQGRVPTAEVCIEVAVLKAVDVPLEEPLAGREIRDGAEAK